MKKLKEDWGMIELAFDDSSYEHSHFLDLETGEVLFVAEELSYAESLDGKGDTDAESDEDMPEWQT